MSQKLIIILAVQSALVLGIGGVALGMNAGGSPEPSAAHGKKAKKKKAPPIEEEADAETEEDEAVAHEPRDDARPTKARHHPTDERVARPKKEHAVVEEEEAAHAPPPAEHREEPKKPHGAAKPADDEHPAPTTPSHEPAVAPKDPLEAFAWLDEGNTRWTQGLVKSRDLVALREGMAKRFEPWAMVVSCGDGRVVPEVVFDVAPGSLVTVSSPTLDVSPPLLTSVDRSLARFTPKVVVLLGHGGCGKGDPSAVVTKLAAKVMNGKPVRTRLAASQLLVLRATYDLSTGRVRWLDSEENDGHPQAAAVPSGHH